MKSCWEIVVFEVDDSRIPEFMQARKTVYQSIRKMKGFLSARTLRSVRGDHVYADILEWESYEDAMKAHSDFKNIPGAGEFMKTIKAVKLSNHFEVMISENPESRSLD